MRNVKEIIKEMSTGLNLGNSFDAFTYAQDKTGGETGWGNPVTTKKMMDVLAETGFNLIRIPVTWYEELGPAPDYKINIQRLNRLKEVIDYAVSNQMYVIINTHHENSWIIPSYAHYETVEDKFIKLWRQIAIHFKEYGENLFFEGLNEPRIEGGPDEWHGATKEVREIINKLNAAFVQTVRATGGNNAIRGLIITTPAASYSDIAVEELKIPEDDNIIVSIHTYLPHAFSYEYGDNSDIKIWDGSQNYIIDHVFEKLNDTFILKNIPVILTEYGAVHKVYTDSQGNRRNNEEEVIKWTRYFLKKAEQYGIKCIWWDNNYYNSGDEYFGLFNRNDCSWYRPELVDAIIKAIAK